MKSSKKLRWAVNGHKQHLFEVGQEYSACRVLAYLGDNPSYESKAKRCKLCEQIERGMRTP